MVSRLIIKRKHIVAYLVFSGIVLGLCWSDPATLVSAKRTGDLKDNHAESAEAQGQLRDGPALRELTGSFRLASSRMLVNWTAAQSFPRAAPAITCFLPLRALSLN